MSLQENHPWRQKFHLEPPDGWLNDPNGLAFFQDTFYAYFQYTPDSPVGKGQRGWGLYTTKDFVHWTWHGMAIAPDIPEDSSGAYSGCAVPFADHLELFYTGNVKEPGDYDYTYKGRQANVIRVRVAGPSAVKPADKEILLRNKDYPSDMSCHVRDPNVWREGETWHMLLGARTMQDEGCVLEYTSPDLERWTYKRRYTLPDFGYMWECPCMFTLDGKRYLGVCPQGLPHEETRFQNVYSAGYFRLNDGALEDYEEWDYGFDFYAPQVYTSPQGARVLVGWMGIGDIPYENPTAALGWQHCLTAPRELFHDEDGWVCQKLPDGTQRFRSDPIQIPADGSARVTAPVELLGENPQNESFTWCIAGSMYLQYEPGKKRFKLWFEEDDAGHALGGGRTLRQCAMEKCRKIQVLLDRTSAEIFLDGGKKVLTTRLYPNYGEDAALEIGAQGIGLTAYPWQND